MKLKKMLASLVATALVGSAFAMTSTLSASAEDIGTAYLCYSGAVQQWNIGDLGGSYATITGNGDYTVSIDLTEDQGSEKMELLFIQSDINIYGQDANENNLYDEMVFRVNSITVDGNEIAYTGPSDGADSTSDDGNNYRLNILNTWGNSVQDIDGNIAHSSNITVNFTVSGIKEAQSDTEETPAPEETEAEETKAEETKAEETKAEETKAEETKAEETKSDNKSDTATKSDSGSTTTKSDSNNDNKDAIATEATANATGDNGIASIVLVCSLAGAGFVASRKKD